MSFYKRILVCLDGSDSSKNALRQACNMAKGANVWIVAITVVPDYSDQFTSLSMQERASKALRREGEKTISEAEEIAREEDIFIRTLLVEGNSTVDAIVDAASERSFDLTIVGKHGRKMLSNALVGGVTSGVIGLSATDVLVVHKNSLIKWNKIIVAADNSEIGTRAVKRAIELANSYRGELIAVSAVDVTDEFQALAPEAVDVLIENSKGFIETVLNDAEEAGIRAKSHVRQGETYRVITDMAREENADMIVMGSHGRKGLKRMIMGSVAEKVIGYAPCPVLVVKNTESEIEE